MNAQQKKLTWDAVKEIRQAVSRGMKQKEMARKFSVHEAMISRIVRKLDWKRDYDVN